MWYAHERDNNVFAVFTPDPTGVPDGATPVVGAEGLDETAAIQAEELIKNEMGEWVYDPTTALAAAREKKITQIKRRAAELIGAISWKVERAKERFDAGFGTLAELDAVLAEREAIRASSNAAEQIVMNMTSVRDILQFSWSVDPTLVKVPRRITRVEFLSRFTDTEVESIVAAAETNTQLKVWWERFRVAETINLDAPDVSAGVNALEIAGVLPQGRSVEILA